MIANSHLVPRWATWEEFRRLEAMGLTMYGQMTAGWWIYIGTQGIVQGTYETFAECAPAAFRRLAGGPAGGHRRAGRNGRRAAAGRHDRRGGHPGVDVDPRRIERRLATGYCDMTVDDLDKALTVVAAARERREAVSVGLLGNIADVLPELHRRGVASTC